jgi:hypothetical protein
MPNPSRGPTQLSFAIPSTDRVTLRLFNVRGALVATLFDAMARGQQVYRVPFRTEDIASGVYFQRLESGTTHLTRKLVVLR